MVRLHGFSHLARSEALINSKLRSLTSQARASWRTNRVTREIGASVLNLTFLGADGEYEPSRKVAVMHQRISPCGPADIRFDAIKSRHHNFRPSCPLMLHCDWYRKSGHRQSENENDTTIRRQLAEPFETARTQSATGNFDLRPMGCLPRLNTRNLVVTLVSDNPEMPSADLTLTSVYLRLRYPRKWTFAAQKGMSAIGQKRHAPHQIISLFDQLVGTD